MRRHQQAQRRPRHRRRLLWPLLIIVLGLGIYSYTRPLPALYPVNDVETAPTATASLAWPGTGEAAIGAVGYGILATHGGQVERPTASTAKLITALMVLKKYPLSLGQQQTPVITLGPADVALYNKYYQEDGSLALVANGEHISEYQALEAMLLPSANNMADSLAIWAYGSLPQYSVAANNFLKSLGLTHTRVGSDASGFLPDTTSTAQDLDLLGINAMENPVIAQIVSQKQATIPVAGTVQNVNWLLGEDGIIGVKTGDTNQAGGVYIFAAQDTLDTTHQVTIVGSIEGVATLQNALDAAIPLLNSAKSQFEVTQVVQAGQAVAHYNVPWSSTPVVATANQSLSAATWLGTPPKTALSLPAIYAAQPVHTTVGSLTLYSASHVTTPVALQQRLPTPPWWWRVFRHRL